MIDICPADLAWIIREWVRCEPFLQRVWQRQDCAFDLAFVWSRIIGRQAQFWPGNRCCVVTKIEKVGDETSCHLWLAGGVGIADLTSIERSIATWAKTLGCKHLHITGRKGWLRVLPDYRADGDVLIKDI